MHKNREVCEKMKQAKDAAAATDFQTGDAMPDADAISLTPTVIAFKNIGPEEMMARCDPDRAGRTSWSLLRAEAEMGAF